MMPILNALKVEIGPM
jgi:hypothetical protein